MDILPFLLKRENDPWVRYRTLLDLIGAAPDDPQVIAARTQMLAHPLVRALLEELASWPGKVISSHKSAGQLYHKLAYLADIGLQAGDDGIDEVLSKIAGHISAEGLPQLPTNIPIHFGGSGKDTWAWALCDTPLQLDILNRMRYSDQDTVRRGVDYLVGMVRVNGWPCIVSKELGKFRGPGRKDDPCPYATLLMVKLLLGMPGYQDSPATLAGIESILNLWQNSLEQHPYQFYMGTDFRKLKVPFIWYDILHVADVLSRSPAARQDARIQSMIELINSKADANDLFTPESEWKAWNNWEFGQKKQPSPWLTFIVARIMRRMGLDDAK